ncbi:Ankyrin repeat-containing domain, partial [Trinorchestia longiramus]
MGCGSSALPSNPMDSLENMLTSIIKGKMPAEMLDSILNRDNVNTKLDVDELKDVTPLIVATKADKIDVVEIILARSPDLAVTDDDGNTALHIAVRGGNADMVQKLITAGSDVNSSNEAGQPVVRTAILENDTTQILEKLLEAGAKTDYTDPEPPLQTAAENEKVEAVQVLLKNNADPKGVQVKLPSGEEVDLLTWATKNEHSTILGILALGGNIPD